MGCKIIGQACIYSKQHIYRIYNASAVHKNSAECSISPVRTLSQDSYHTVQILCIGTDRSQQTVQTKIRLLLKKQSDQGLRCLPFQQHLLDALMQCLHQTFLYLGQLWQLFEVSQILEFLPYLFSYRTGFAPL